MKTLLHICCAPCANQPIEVLRGDKIEVTGFWYNPNIHPFTEYRSRRNCVREYAPTIELPLIEKDDYGLRPYGCPDYLSRLPRCLTEVPYRTRHTKEKAGTDNTEQSSGRAGQEIRRFDKNVPKRESTQKTTWAPVKTGFLRGFPLAPFAYFCADKSMPSET